MTARKGGRRKTGAHKGGVSKRQRGFPDLDARDAGSERDIPIIGGDGEPVTAQEAVTEPITGMTGQTLAVLGADPEPGPGSDPVPDQPPIATEVEADLPAETEPPEDDTIAELRAEIAELRAQAEVASMASDEVVLARMGVSERVDDDEAEFEFDGDEADSDVGEGDEPEAKDLVDYSYLTDEWIVAKGGSPPTGLMIAKKQQEKGSPLEVNERIAVIGHSISLRKKIRANIDPGLQTARSRPI